MFVDGQREVCMVMVEGERHRGGKVGAERMVVQSSGSNSSYHLRCLLSLLTLCTKKKVKLEMYEDKEGDGQWECERESVKVNYMQRY